MAKDRGPSTGSGVPASVILYPVLGLLAVGNVVFLLLWLLQPLATGTSGPRGGRRVRVRGGARALTVAEGIDAKGPAVGIDARLGSERFEDLTKQLMRLAQSRRGAEQAAAFFETDFGRQAEPAVTITFPRRTGSEALDVYVLDARRQLCYCRAGRERAPLAIKAAAYKEIAAQLARLGHGSAGSFAVPYYTALDEGLKAKLGTLKGQLQVTTISSNPHQLFLDLAGSPALASRLQLERPDPSSLIATLSLPPYGAMARALAEALARASDKVTARHLDLVDSTEAVREVARSLRRSVSDVEDSLVLQYGERTRVIRSDELLARDEGGPLAPGTTRFEGEQVLAKALDGLLAERGLLYFAEGHGERRLADTTRAGLSRPAEQLKARGFRVATLDLAKAKSIPKDCQALVLAGPRKPYGAELEAAVGRYLEAGGRLAVLLDPPHSPAVLAKPLARYGLGLDEPTQEFQAVQVELNHKLDFARGWTREPVVFFTAVALAAKPPPKEGTYRTHRVGRALERMPSSRPPCLLAAAQPAPGAKGPKLLLVGDVDVFCNQSLTGLPGSLFGQPGRVIQLPGNIELFVQALSWLAE